MPRVSFNALCNLIIIILKNWIVTSHDWGAQVCWEAARMRPDIFEAVAAAVVPVCALQHNNSRQPETEDYITCST